MVVGLSTLRAGSLARCHITFVPIPLMFVWLSLCLARPPLHLKITCFPSLLPLALHRHQRVEGRRVVLSRREPEIKGEGEEELACGGRTVAGVGWPGRVGAWFRLTYARRAHRLRARGPRRTSRRGRAQPTTHLADADGDVVAGRHHGSHE